MLISTRGRYALRVMVDLAEHSDGNYIAMKSVAQRQQISLKYLEKIMPLLVGAKLVKAVHGKGGGYLLTKEPKEYRLGEILRLTEGGLSPVSCSACGSAGEEASCDRVTGCRTLPVWNELDRRINEYLDSVTIADLMK